MAKTDIVILNWNGERHLGEFLPSVVANSPACVRITVADNGSTDGSVQLVERGFPTVNVIKFSENYGFAEGYNRALADPCFEDTDYFLLLNSDVETPAGWIEPLVGYLDRNPDTAAVAPKILSYTDRGSFEYAGASGGFIDRLGYPFCRGRILSKVEKDSGQYDDAREVFWATGACILIRSRVFRDLGGFDASFFAHMEEIDLCWRARLAGWKVAVEPASAVFHLGGGTLAVDSPHKLYLNYRNSLSMLYKNLPRRGRTCTVTLRMIADGCSALIYLASFRRQAFLAVWRAHRDFRRQKRDIRQRSAEVHGKRPLTHIAGVYRGSIILRYIFGKRTFGRML